MIADGEKNNVFLQPKTRRYLPLFQKVRLKIFSLFVSLIGSCAVWSVGVVLVMWPSAPVLAIVPRPSQAQILEAIEKGQEGARNKMPPNRLYWRFGSLEDDSQPHGFLITKLSGIAVLSGHFFLRGEQPSSQEIQRVLNEEVLQVVVMIFGNSPTFARGSYLLLKQKDQLIKPARIRFDARATLLTPQQGESKFRAKVVASFLYGTFGSEAPTTIKVFPGVGGEMTFDLDFSVIP